MIKCRQILFWLHLACGLVAGLMIGLMSFTGAALAFEKEIVAWAGRDVRHVAPPSAGATRLSLDDMVKRVRAARPELRPTNVVVSSDSQNAVAVSAGKEDVFYVNPWSGKVRPEGAEGMRRFMSAVKSWHRTLGREGDQRAVGAAITGICNAALLVLTVTGLCLWWPRAWSWRGLRTMAWFNFSLTGKARDWNWHNAIGLWSAPVLIVLTATALPMSYEWIVERINRLDDPRIATQTGGTGGFAQLTAVEVPAAPVGVKPLDYDALFAAASAAAPHWKTITLRSGTGSRAATASIRDSGSWPRTAVLKFSLDPFTGAVLRREGYAELPVSGRVHAWTRFLHTGEALGWPGQLAAGLACFGGCVLVWTGFALAWRRFFGTPSAEVLNCASAAGSEIGRIRVT